VPQPYPPTGREPGVARVGATAAQTLARGDQLVAVDGRRVVAVGVNGVDAAHWSEYTEVEFAIMTERELLDRITFNPKIFGGRALIRGHRLAVAQVLAMLADGATPAKLLENYPWLEIDDISACLLFAARVVGGEQLPVAVNE
jgi:uncharacterized protein (DUF433 family)